MLPEGANRKIVCRSWRLDEKDFFGLLLKIATHDTIGAIIVKEVESWKNSIIAHPPLPSGLWEIRRTYRSEEETYRNDPRLFFSLARRSWAFDQQFFLTDKMKRTYLRIVKERIQRFNRKSKWEIFWLGEVPFYGQFPLSQEKV